MLKCPICGRWTNGDKLNKYEEHTGLIAFDCPQCKRRVSAPYTPYMKTDFIHSAQNIETGINAIWWIIIAICFAIAMGIFS